MLKVFPIDFIRQILEQTLYEEHLNNVGFYGGSNQVNLFSFYEQLKEQDEIDRFVETYRDLSEQQNRTGLIMNGILVSPENPSITNLYSSTIIPLSWTCSFRVKLENRDNAIITINNLIEKLKGRKVDVAQLNGVIDMNGKHISMPFKVGTLGENNFDTVKSVVDRDYLGVISESYLNRDVNALLTSLNDKGFVTPLIKPYMYVSNGTQLKVVAYQNNIWHLPTNDGTNDYIFPPTHTSFDKYKVSMSFDAIRCDEPRTLNANAYCEISFGGSATIVNSSVKLGNDLLGMYMQKKKIVADTDIVFSNAPKYFLEPLEMPSGNNADTQINHLVSNNFVVNTHTNSLALTLQYSFILDESNAFLSQLFNYARYGTQGTTINDISPNMIYETCEIWSSWGNYEEKKFLTKIVENVDIENTESDTLTIGIVLQIQGANN